MKKIILMIALGSILLFANESNKSVEASSLSYEKDHNSSSKTENDREVDPSSDTNTSELKDINETKSILDSGDNSTSSKTENHKSEENIDELKDTNEKLLQDNKSLNEKIKELEKSIQEVKYTNDMLLQDKEQLVNEKLSLKDELDSQNTKYNKLEEVYKKSQESFFSWSGVAKVVGLLWLLFMFVLFLRKKFMS